MVRKRKRPRTLDRNRPAMDERQRRGGSQNPAAMPTASHAACSNSQDARRPLQRFPGLHLQSLGASLFCAVSFETKISKRALRFGACLDISGGNSAQSFSLFLFVGDRPSFFLPPHRSINYGSLCRLELAPQQVRPRRPPLVRCQPYPLLVLSLS